MMHDETSSAFEWLFHSATGLLSAVVAALWWMLKRKVTQMDDEHKERLIHEAEQEQRLTRLETLIETKKRR